MYPIYLLLVFQSQISPRFTLYGQPFRVTGHFVTMIAQKNSKIAQNATMSNVLHLCATSVIVFFKMTLALWQAVFELQAISETIAPNDSKMNFDTTRLNIPHIHVCSTSAPMSQCEFSTLK